SFSCLPVIFFFRLRAGWHRHSFQGNYKSFKFSIFALLNSIMKKLIVLAVIFCFQLLNAQFVINLGKNNYYESKVYLENGTEKQGYLLEFGDKKVVNFQPQLIAESFASSETRFGLSDKYFYFRENERGDDEKIPFADIRKIERKEFKPGSNEP